MPLELDAGMRQSLSWIYKNKNAVIVADCCIWSNAGKVLKEQIILKVWLLVSDGALGDKRNYILNDQTERENMKKIQHRQPDDIHSRSLS